MNEKARKLVNSMTTIGGNNKAWKQAVWRAYSLFGEEALYYLNCERFACDEEDVPFALPYEEWKDGRRHLGVQIQHTYVEEIDGEYHLVSYGDEVYMLA